MKTRTHLCLGLLTLVLLIGAGTAQSQNRTSAKSKPGKGERIVTPQAGPPLVQGSGTIGQISKWVTFTGTNFVLGDSIITEANGNIGIDTITPGSKLTAQGMIETTLGGIKFPDGTVQTTAAVGSLLSVEHDATLVGDGTAASPLGVAIPLHLSRPVPDSAIITVENTAENGDGVFARGGIFGVAVDARGSNSSGMGGGDGVFAIGGDSNTSGGDGLLAGGGQGNIGGGGHGVLAFGGLSNSGIGGIGVSALGGASIKGVGGDAVFAGGGGSESGDGGNGVLALGGFSNSAGKSAGDGLLAFRGSGVNGASDGLAGFFEGDVAIQGNFEVTGGTKNFKIDHPLDPENKYLVHAAVESSEVLNLYTGNVTTDANGEAVVRLPAWFETLNKDLRYQLTVIGTFAQAIVANEVQNNRFTIQTNAPSVKVSWQVTAVRSDAVMKKHPFKTEQAKPERERGTYLNPEAYDQPEERGVQWARHPELMRQIKQSRDRGNRKNER